MRKIITTMALLALTSAVQAKELSHADYLAAQAKAKAECTGVKSWVMDKKADLPKPHSDFGVMTEIEAGCIDKVVEAYIMLKPTVIHDSQLTGRFLGMERQKLHTEFCKLDLIQDIEWDLWVTYYSKFNRRISTVIISKQSCAEYGVTK